MTNQEQEGEPVDAESDPTAELEVLPEPDPERVGAGQVIEPFYIDERIDGVGAKRADDAFRTEGPGSGAAELHDALDSLRTELHSVRTLAESLEQDIQDSEGVIVLLAREVKTTRMKQAETEKLLDQCRSEIQRLRSQMETVRVEESVPLHSPGAGLDGASAAASPEASDPECEPVLQELPEAVIDELRVIARSIDPARAPVVPISAADERTEPEIPERKLVVRNCNTTKSYALDAESVRLGSSPENEIRLNSTYVSRHHAEFDIIGTECVLRDLDSTNGTFVNRRRVKRCVLRNGDWIAIGKHRFEFVEQKRMTGSA